jgi:hypothetical protein
VHIPEGFSYLPGTGMVAGVLNEPVADGNWLAWSEAAQDTTVGFDLVAGPVMADGRYDTEGFTRDPVTGAILSDVATARLIRDEEAVFDCTAVTGTVFKDINHDGFRQSDEPGIAGVELALDGEVSVLSRRNGFYDLACAMTGRDRSGQEVEVDLKQPTLPPGYVSTTPVSQRLALRRGHVAHADFGAASLPFIDFRLGPDSFEHDTARLAPDALNSLARLIVRLERRPAVLRILYPNAAGDRLAAQRVEAVRALADGAWKAGARPHELVIQTQAGE